MTDFKQRATQLAPEMVADRRTFHTLGGQRFDLEPAEALIKKRLTEWGIEWTQRGQCAVSADIGDPSKGATILLRADYDALPLEEESGLPFAATNGTCHACGHDFHVTMLLYAAKMLKECESELSGRVRFMFQPAEETVAGARMMVENGVLEGVDAGFAMHVASGREQSQSGRIRYSRGATYSAVDRFEIVVTGKGGHGALPHQTIDPIGTMARIILAVQQLLAYERESDKMLVISFGTVQSGTAFNIIPNTATATGTMRTFDPELRERIKARFTEVVELTGASMGAKAELNYNIAGSCGPVINDAAFAEKIRPYLEQVVGSENVELLDIPTSFGSEDFSYISSAVPAAILSVGTGSIDQGYTYGMHHPKVMFDEDVLPTGAQLHATVAMNWLESKKV